MVTAIKVKQNIKLYVGATIYAIGMVQTIFSPFDEFISAGFVAHIILIGTFYYCMIQAKEVLASLGKYVYSIALYSLMVIVFITITRIGEVLSTDGSIISVSVSLLWMVYALFAVWFGRYRQMNEILYAGLVVLVVTVGKLFLLDLPEVSMMIRAVLFLIVGSIGIVISRMFFSKEGEVRKRQSLYGLPFFLLYLLPIVTASLYLAVVFCLRRSVACPVVFGLSCTFTIFSADPWLFVMKENALLYPKEDGQVPFVF